MLSQLYFCFSLCVLFVCLFAFLTIFSNTIMLLTGGRIEINCCLVEKPFFSKDLFSLEGITYIICKKVFEFVLIKLKAVLSRANMMIIIIIIIFCKGLGISEPIRMRLLDCVCGFFVPQVDWRFHLLSYWTVSIY